MPGSGGPASTAFVDRFLYSLQRSRAVARPSCDAIVDTGQLSSPGECVGGRDRIGGAEPDHRMTLATAMPVRVFSESTET
jgi:hypothetical protein